MELLHQHREELEELKDILVRDEIIDGKVVYDMIKNVRE
jgi:ATP-dependent Zn protease